MGVVACSTPRHFDTMLLMLVLLLGILLPNTVLSQSNCTAGDIRLSNGATPLEGRVEVCISGQWGTITDDGFRSTDARVVCRQLGYNDKYVLPWVSAYFGAGTGMPILMDNIRCTGTEQRLVDCPFNSPSGDSHNEDAGVRCYDNTGGACTTGAVRLVGGSTDREGRVEVCLGGLWGTIADTNGWTLSDAKVICRQLGYIDDFGLTYHFGRPFPRGTGHIWMTRLSCVGTEETVWDCPYDSGQGKSHSEDVGLQCFETASNPNCNLGDLRLVNGQNNMEGRIEICFNGIWGTIADDNWHNADAKVACRHLGFAANGARAFSNAYFGQGSDPIWCDNIGCFGTEDNFFNCVVMTGSTSLDFHNEDAGLRCQSLDCTEGDVRLLNGSIPAEGRVELCFEGKWSTVCDKGWTNEDAQVVCNQLGYGQNHSYAYPDAYFGSNTNLPILVDDIRCVGSEANLQKCPFSTFIQSSTCRSDHSDDAGIRCVSGGECENGDLRLVGGTVPSRGRLEVCIDGLWGTVSDDGFARHEGAIACKQLGYYPNYAYVRSNAYYGQGTGIVHMDAVVCRGSESRLVDCQYRPADHSDTHSEDVGVECIPLGTCTSGDVRLVGGTNNMEGRVEICISQVWGTVTDDYWSGRDAQVVCRQLGFADGYGLPYGNARFGQGVDPIAMDIVQCLGNETMLIDCPYNIPIFDYHSEDAGVRCFSDAGSPCNHGDLRLIDGSNITQGVLEVCFDGTWGSVCDNYWTTPDAEIACKQLGFASAGAKPVIRAGLGQSTGPIWLTEASCLGDEQKLVECRIDANTNYCTHSKDAGLICLPRECAEGATRLVGGSVVEEGRVEVCRNGRWGTVCDNGWGINDAKVVCRQLGYSTDTVFAFMQASHGAGTDWIWANNVQCNGNENRLLDCSFDTNTAGCTHADDAAVRCVPGGTCTHGDLKLVGDDDCDEGLVEVCLNGHWGTVNIEGWDANEATVVCKQLGYYARAGVPLRGSSFATGSGLILMTKLGCTGAESRLVDCPFQSDTSQYDHNSDAGVKCFQAEVCRTGDVRLTGGSSSSFGRVEICFGGKWGTVADTAWNVDAATVVCRQLGYTDGKTWPTTYTKCAPIFLRAAKCTGNEAKLVDCTLDSDTSESTHNQDVAAFCSGRGGVVFSASRSEPSSSVVTPVLPIASRQPLTVEAVPFAVGIVVVVGVLLVLMSILIVAVIVVIVRKRRADMPVDKMGLVVNAQFPKDTATPVHILNSTYDDSYAGEAEPHVNISEEKQ